MNKPDEILTILMEECAEVIQACTKIKRFGADDNVNALAKELGDLQCMINLVYEFGVLDNDSREFFVEQKRNKLHQFSFIFNGS